MIERIKQFIELVRNETEEIKVSSVDTSILDLYENHTDEKFNNTFSLPLNMFVDQMGDAPSADTKQMFYLTSTQLRWRRPERRPAEGYLAGGFAVNGMLDLLLGPSQFWENSTEVFKTVGQEGLVDYDLLKQFGWFESVTPVVFQEYTPQFGCTMLDKETFLKNFFFYDSGLVFPLPFNSPEQYFAALTASASVECWQYFYVDPELIVSKSKGVKYITWAAHTTTNLDVALRSIQFKANSQYDRLDLVMEYMERCVRLLPGAFPFLDFHHHKAHFTKVKEIYERTR